MSEPIEFNNNQRKTSQYLLPEIKPESHNESYDIYPSFRIDENQILKGFNSIAELFTGYRNIIIDGYTGVFYDDFRKKISKYLNFRGKKLSWQRSLDFLKPAEEIDRMISPYTGGDDPVFGKKTDLSLEDFFNIPGLKSIKPDQDADISFIIGPGASMAGWKGLLVYIDLPKNEIQFRSRAGSIVNLGSLAPEDPKLMYKRYYFIDWVVFNKHKRAILPDIDVVIDGQHPDDPSWMKGNVLRKSLSVMSRNLFRVRPWFEPGTWGGSWIKDNIGALNHNVPNYAWSFELIAPENGLLFESSGILLEVSFDTLMFQEGKALLGDCSERFGINFPIRFDFLDTFNGGNLSVQCHPRTEYMKQHFGEDFTQEETYYILDTRDNAQVYLGFCDSINPDEFRQELEDSFLESKTVDIEKHVQKHYASKHDLFLIPPGTIHGSGKNNLVLEISSTPYIFTFKMYDWLRPDLDGKPRPLNISRAMDNLYFDRKGSYNEEKLISKPVLMDKGNDWQLWHLPTHEMHLYDVHRYHLNNSAEIDIETKNKCHVLNLVEGSSIMVVTRDGMKSIFHYAETFVIPAATNSYRITNLSENEAIIVKAFVK